MRIRQLAIAFTVTLALTLCAGFMSSDKALAYPENPLPYRIHVSRSAQIVTVTSTETGEVVRQMICSTGAAGTPTITGKFKMPAPGSDERKNWYAFSGSSWAHYASRIRGGYLFHSILYTAPATSSLVRSSWSMIGQRASHGCVRLTPLDAQWIAYNCAGGTEVTINDAKPKGPITTSSQIKKTLPSARSDGSLPGWEATLKPTPKPSEQTPPTLNVGIEGSRTKSMQDTLRSLGHFTGTVNGKFGTDTQAALIRFQELYLSIHPNMTEETEANGIGTPVWQSRVKAAKGNTAYAGTARTLKLNMAGVSVKVLREQLYNLKYTTLTPAGTYSSVIRDSVKLYQRANHMAITGIATEAVQQAILAGGQKPLASGSVNNRGGLSVRKSNSAGSAVVVKLKDNARLRVVKYEGEWSYVAAGKYSGYVLSKYVEYDDPALNPATEITV